jgi:hypothetical protein
MQKLSIQDLDQIPLIPLTAELARRGITLTAELAASRLGFALHEAAHLVAAIACPRSTIHHVWVYPKVKGKRGVGGTFRSDECLSFEEAFVSMAGYAWEELHGDVATAKGDYTRATTEHPNHLEALTTARAFIMAHDTVIRHAAVGILSLCTVQGLLDGDRLKALRRWLKPSITPFRSAHAE